LSNERPVLDIQCVYNGRDAVGECPVWDAEAQTLYWVDVNRGRVYRMDALGVVNRWQFEAPVSAAALTTVPGSMIVAAGGSLLRWSPNDDSRSVLAEVETRWPAMRLNDGCVGPGGELWIGSMSNNVAADGSGIAVSDWGDGTLYRVEGDGSVTSIDKGFQVPNTVAWSTNGQTFYCGCSIENTIWAYDYDTATRSILHRRPFFRPSKPGCVDGSAIDADGYLWNCRWGGSAILRISPEGKVVSKLEMPVTNPTHCTFGGPSMTSLYVTSAALETPEDEAFAGGLFRIETGIRGLPAKRFSVSA
jgi:sugar lactone lactonase YvrE